MENSLRSEAEMNISKKHSKSQGIQCYALPISLTHKLHVGSVVLFEIFPLLKKYYWYFPALPVG